MKKQPGDWGQLSKWIREMRAGLGGGWWRGTGRLSFFQGSQSLFCPLFSGWDVGSDCPDLGGGVEPGGLRGDGFS